MAEKLRFGIMCNGTDFQRWQADAIRSLVESGMARPTLLIQPDKRPPQKRSFFEKLRYYPWRMGLYMYWRKRFFKPPAMDMVSVDELLRSITSLECAVEKRKHSEYFQTADVEAIRSKDLHFILRFSFNIIRGDILNAAKYGVWSFHHGDEEKYRGGPPGFWEVVNDDPVSGSVLQRLTDRLDGGIILKKGIYATIDHSITGNVQQLLERSSPWPLAVCQDIAIGEANYLNAAPSKTDAPIFKYPGNLQFLSALFKVKRNKASFHRSELKDHEEWNAAVVYQPIANFLDGKSSLNMRWLPDPLLGTYRADPFGYMLDGELNLLYEKYDYKTGKGIISRVRPKKDGILKRSRALLEAEEHFSYPYTFEHDGDIYVLPECYQKGRLDLYKIDRQENSLEFVQTLIEDVPAIDPTLTFVDDKWWLFYTLPENSNSELHIQYSNSLFGPYQPHAANPVKRDVRSSRPAGTPFIHEGNLYRPAQDCSETYGGRIAFNKVHRLTTKAFEESVEKFVGPIKGPYDKGMHTICAMGDITIIDGKRFVTVQDQKRRQMERKMQRLRRQGKK